MSFLAKFKHKFRATDINAGWSSPVARQAHNLKVAGSNPAPATKYHKIDHKPLADGCARHSCLSWGLDAL